METIIKINNQTAGRDKIARLLQYLSRLLWHRLQQQHKNGVAGLKNLEFQLSTFRKLLRFGRFFEGLYATLPLFQHPDPALRYYVILSKICNSLFLLADHILWLGRADVCTIDTEKWSRMSNKYWLFSITMNLVRDFHEIMNILKLEKRNILPKNGIQSLKDLLDVILHGFAIIQQRDSVFIDTIKNGCDFFIPLTALGYVKMSPGTIGFLGVISSLAGLMVLIDPKNKLSPS